MNGIFKGFFNIRRAKESGRGFTNLFWCVPPSQAFGCSYYSHDDNDNFNSIVITLFYTGCFKGGTFIVLNFTRFCYKIVNMASYRSIRRINHQRLLLCMIYITMVTN